jgi:hypothetical protein
VPAVHSRIARDKQLGAENVPRPSATCDRIWERILLSKSEQRVFRTFREYLMTPGRMLCFSGPDLQRNATTLTVLTEKGLLVKEKFEGGYSLTPAGYAAMNNCESCAEN